MHRLGVDVRYHTLATAADVLREEPDAVLIATGGTPDLCGADDDPDVAPNVVSVWDVLAGTTPVEPGSSVLLLSLIHI